MSWRTSWLWLAVCAALALGSRAQLRQGAVGRCALDGAAIQAGARVDLREGGLPAASFCSVECALAWPAEPRGERRYVVHEERHGTPLDPAAAYFVRSRLGRDGAHGRLRAFEDPVAAAEHARVFAGTPVPNPFAQEPR